MVFWAGAALIGLACGQALYAVIATTPPSPFLFPLWARIFFVAMPAYLAIREGRGTLRLAWASVAAWSAVSWAFAEQMEMTIPILVLAALQMLTGGLFVRASIPAVPVQRRVFGLLVAVLAAAARIGSTYWWARTLSRHGLHG